MLLAAVGLAGWLGSSLASPAALVTKPILGHRTALAKPHHPHLLHGPRAHVKHHEQPGELGPQKLRPRDVVLPPGKYQKTPDPLPPAIKRAISSGHIATDVTVSTRTDLINSRFGFPQEPTAASGGGVVVMTGNADAYFSVDNGTTFHEIDPSSLFNPDGSDGTFCCDQVVKYSPVVNRFFWLAQANQKGYVLAVASPEAIASNFRLGRTASMAWRTYSLTPAFLGQPTWWFDYPDVAVGQHALWLEWNTLRLGGGNIGTMLVRMNLRQLADGGPYSAYHWELNGSETFDRLAQEPNIVGYMIGNDQGGDPGKMTIRYMSETSPYLNTAQVTHYATPSADYCSGIPPATTNPCPNPENWLSLGGFKIGGATVRGGQLWVADLAGRHFPGGQASDWPQPHVQVIVYNLTLAPAPNGGITVGFAHNREIATANTTYAVSFAALASDPAGDVAMSYSFGGNTIPASPAVMLLAGSTTGSARVATADMIPRADVARAPNGLDRTQGDYSAVQPDGNARSGFVTAGYAARSDLQNHWTFMRFSPSR